MARQELARARAASARTARLFSPREQEGERQLGSLVDQLLRQGPEMGTDADRLAALRAFYEGPLLGKIRQRLHEEQVGTEQAFARAESIGHWIHAGGLTGSVLTLVMVFFACLHSP